MAGKVSTNQRLRALVVGGGAVGALYGWRLQASGQCDVALVCRSNFEAARDTGLSVVSGRYGGESLFRPAAGVFASVADAAHAAAQPDTSFDYILVATKELPNRSSTADLVAPLVEACKPGTPLVLLQNGINTESPLLDRFPETPIVSCAVYCDIAPSDDSMQRFDHGGVVQLVLGIRKQDPRSLPTKQEVAVVLDPLTAALRAGDVECVVPRGVQEDPATHGDTIQAHKWVKLVWNAAFNPVSAFAGGMTTRTILQDPQLRQVVRSAMDEVHAVGQADIGGPLPPSVRPSAPEEMIAFTESRGSVTPSMMVDLQQKRPMEREALLGNAVAAGARLGVPTPVLHTLYALLTAIERTYSS